MEVKEEYCLACHFLGTEEELLVVLVKTYQRYFQLFRFTHLALLNNLCLVGLTVNP